jgi:hypothetical protein
MTKTRKYKNYILLDATAKSRKPKYTKKMSVRSYSPSINKNINFKKTNNNMIDLFSCKKRLPKKISYHLSRNKSKKINANFLSKLKKFIYGIEINVDLKKRICNNLSSKSALKAMLHNIYNQQPLIIGNITPPKQILSNCWFNTFFMVFFVSDKGRKFFKHFRELMIIGKTQKNKLISPSLRASFILLNYSIEACYNYFGSSNKIAKNIDTNYLINFIFNSIQNKTSKFNYIKNVNDAGNPLKYYMDIVDYLDNSIINILNISSSYDDIINTTYIETRLKLFNKAPHMIVLEMWESYNYKKEETLLLKYKNSNVIYKLDSVVIRTTNGEHFASTITCNKEELVFDGASKKKIKNFNWKSKINTDENWSFDSHEYSASEYNWNFKNGYQMFFYYRV